jgi:hypothetical protein
VCSERPRRKISFESSEGVEIPVVETKKIAPISVGSTPDLSNALRAAFSESSRACST